MFETILTFKTKKEYSDIFLATRLGNACLDFGTCLDFGLLSIGDSIVTVDGTEWKVISDDLSSRRFEISTPPEKYYAAFYTAPPPTFEGVFKTLEAAIFKLYPNGGSFRQRRDGVWEGPDGYGEVRLIEIGG